MTYIGPLPAVLRSCQRTTKFFSIQTLRKQEQEFAETFQQINYLQLSPCVQSSGPNHLVQRMSCRISIGHPLDSTGHLVGFYWTSTRILQVCFECLGIKKCNKNFYWTSGKISIGRPLEFSKFASNVLELLISSGNGIKISTGRPVEFLLDVPQNLLDVQ